MLTIIFRVILSIIHWAYVAYEIVESRCFLIQRISSKVYRRLRYGLEKSTNHHRDDDDSSRWIEENSALKKSVENLKKVPVHLCIVVPIKNENISFTDLARILGWSIAVGIPHVSFYDHDGFLKKNQNLFRTECERTTEKLGARIEWNSKAFVTKHTENGCNGFKRPTRVQIFSNEDGKGEIVTLAQNLSRAVTHGLLKTEEINMELLNDKLRLENTPDPDLAFVCGPALSTYGLLPWHTRTTEFFNLRSHRDLSISDFIFLLEKYGMCQQRCGK